MALERKLMIEEAERRVLENSSADVMRRIGDFVREHGLKDEVTLALRMLNSEMLAEFFDSRDELQQQLSQVRDRSALMLTLVNKLDPDVEALAKEHQMASRKAPSRPSPGAAFQGLKRTVVPMPKANVRMELIARADKRFDNPKTPLARRSIERFVKFWGFGDDVKLSLNLLQSAQLREFFAAEDEIVKKFNGETRPCDVVLLFLDTMDPEIASMRAVLQSQDGTMKPVSSRPNLPKPSQGPSPKRKRDESNPSSTSWSEVPKEKKARWDDGERNEQTGKQGMQYHKSEAAKQVLAHLPPQPAHKPPNSSESEADRLVRQAEDRLQRNKSPQNLMRITSFTRRHKLGDECTLALRMMAQPMLDEFMAGQWEIARRIGKCEDPSTVVLALVAGLDAEAADLAQSLFQADVRRAGPAPSAQPAFAGGSGPRLASSVAPAIRHSASSASVPARKNELTTTRDGFVLASGTSGSAAKTSAQGGIPSAARPMDAGNSGPTRKYEPVKARNAMSSAAKPARASAGPWNLWG